MSYIRSQIALAAEQGLDEQDLILATSEANTHYEVDADEFDGVCGVEDGK